MTPPTGEATKKSFDQLFTEDEPSRLEAQNNFVAWGEAGLPVLELGLSDPDPERRITVLKTLAKLGAKARQAYPSIQEAVNDPDPGVQEEAEKAIESLMNED